MTLSMLLLSLALVSPAEIRALPDTARAPKPPPLVPTMERRKPAPPKGKPVGEPQLKRRKPPGFRPLA